MPSSSKIFAPMLALMMVGDARAAPAKFTDKAALNTAVWTCLELSDVGNCCADNSNPAAIVLGTGGDQEGKCDDGYTHLQIWDVSEVADMYDMFYAANAFNQPLNSWSVASVTDMRNMFYKARAFNQPLNDWNVAKVTNMGFMFYEAKAFNQPLHSWDVAKVTSMYSMFAYAYAYNQAPLCGPTWIDSTAIQTNMFWRVKGGGDRATWNSACCPAGTYLNDGQDACTDCAAGKYNDEEDQTACTNCAKGKYNNQLGSTAESACTDCAKGKYNNQVGQDACTQCAYGQSTSDAASDESTDCKNWVKLISDQDILSELSTRQGSCNGQ